MIALFTTLATIYLADKCDDPDNDDNNDPDNDDNNDPDNNNHDHDGTHLSMLSSIRATLPSR